MQSTRKLLAAIIAVAMLFGIVATAAYAAVPADVKGTAYEEAADVLGALKIMIGDDQGNFRPNDNLKRSEFAKIAVTAMGLQDVATSNNSPTKFPDVAANHWANGYINVAVNQGIIIGDNNGNFRPDDNISYAEAVTVLVRILGHEPAALAKGGWPTGYLVVGAQIGVTKNATAPSNSAISRGMIAQMTFNSLTINLMEQTGFGNNIDYQVVDKTLLKDKLNVENIKGQVTATSYSTLSGPSSLGDDRIKIGDQVYNAGGLDVSGLLGYNVSAYIHEDNNGDQTLILARIDQAHNDSMTIAADNIDQVLTTGDKGVKYWVNKDTDTTTKTAYFDNNAIMIYNGVATAWDSNLITPTSGKLDLIDTNADSKYDIVSVTAYDNYVVDSTSALSHSITDKYGKSALILDPDNKNIKFSITKDGQPYKFEDLKEWDVLSVTKSLDGNVIRVQVVQNSISGKVDERDSEYVTIGGKGYKVAANYTNPINISDEGTFYLDIDGKIAAVDTTGTKNGNYAYLVDAASTGTIADNVQFKLFTKDGEVKVMDGADKIKLDGNSAINAKDVLATLKASGAVQPQLVTFQVNSNNQIIEINRAVDRTASLQYDRTNFAKNFEGNDIVYKEASKKLGVFNITDKTIIFDIPAGKTNPDDFAVRNSSMFVDQGKYNVQVYDMTEDLNASVVIVTNSNGKTSAESPIAVVDKITKVKNADNVDVDKLYAYQNGKAISLNASSTGVLVKNGNQPLHQGDIIQFTTNAKGEIDAISVLFDVSRKTVQGIANPAEGLETVYGQVTKTFPHSINVTVNGGNLNNYTTDNVIVYNYDSTKSQNQVTVASAADITKFDPATPKYIFIRIYKDEVKEMVIVE